MKEPRLERPKEADKRLVVVYGLRLGGGNVRYVGVSSDVDRRLYRHMRDTRAGSQLPVHRWMRKHGKPDVVILASCGSYEEAYALERSLVEQYRRDSSGELLNVASGGLGSDGTKGRILTEAHKSAISRANAGQGLGTKRPKWHCEAISNAQKGKKKGPMSPERIQRMSEARKGIPTGPMSDETKRNLSVSLKSAWERRRAGGKGIPTAETKAKTAESLRRFHRERKHAHA